MLVAMHRQIAKISARSPPEEGERTGVQSIMEIKHGISEIGRGAAAMNGMLSARLGELGETLKGLRADISEMKSAIFRIKEKVV